MGPELTADACASTFGLAGEERFPTPEQSPGPGDYSVPEVRDPCAATFGDAGEERFPTPEQSPGAGDYSLAEVRDPCAATFGEAGEERFLHRNKPRAQEIMFFPNVKPRVTLL